MSASTAFSPRRKAISACSAPTANGCSLNSGEGWRLLDMPSAFEMTPEACRWFYKHDAGLDPDRKPSITTRHELRLSIEVLSGSPLRCLLSNHIAIEWR